ncbi:MAG: type II toxin-antitoxin system Phd/YefM family antitoxin [Spirochaetia bacterium]
MKKINISQAKSNLSRYLKDVERGETVLIFHRDKPVARLEPVNWADVPGEDRIRELVRLGIAKAPKRKLNVKAFLAMPGPRLDPGVAARAVVQDREESM